MALINIFKNRQKAKDYDRLEKENEILRNQFNKLKDDVRQVEDYAIGMLTDAPDVHPRLSEIIDVISDYRIRVSDLSMQINRLKSKFHQKRDKVTGRFIKR